MTTTAQLNGSTLIVQVQITNDQTGHHVPTDSPLRHLILLVQATAVDGPTLTQSGGPTLPEWCGLGDPDEGYYAGLPGTGYAKILQEQWTGVSPTGAYWNPTRVLSDNRLAALATSTSASHSFVLCGQRPQDRLGPKHTAGAGELPTRPVHPARENSR